MSPACAWLPKLQYNAVLVRLSYIVLHYIAFYRTLYCITLHYIKSRGQYRCPQLVLGCSFYNTIQSYIVYYIEFYRALHCITLYCITLHYINIDVPSLCMAAHSKIQCRLTLYITLHYIKIRGHYRCPLLALGCPNQSTALHFAALDALNTSHCYSLIIPLYFFINRFINVSQI